MDRPGNDRKPFPVRSHLHRRRQQRQLVERDTQPLGDQSLGTRHPLPAQLRQERRTLLRIRGGPGRSRHHNGRRPARLPRRDTGALPHDNRGGLRPRLGMEAPAPRPDRETVAEQTLQRYGTGDLRHPAPRLQLRPQGVPEESRQEHRGVRRDAPLHPYPRTQGSPASGRRKYTTVHASTATANSAGNAPSKATSTSSRSCSCRASGAVRCTFSADWAR